MLGRIRKPRDGPVAGYVDDHVHGHRVGYFKGSDAVTADLDRSLQYGGRASHQNGTIAFDQDLIVGDQRHIQQSPLVGERHGDKLQRQIGLAGAGRTDNQHAPPCNGHTGRMQSDATLSLLRHDARPG